jgi:hypothetical protein
VSGRVRLSTSEKGQSISPALNIIDVGDQRRRPETEQKSDLENALPSCVTRNKALALAPNPMNGKIIAQVTMIYGLYYTSWSASVYPPEKLDSKFDILYVGSYIFFLFSIIMLIRRISQHL